MGRFNGIGQGEVVNLSTENEKSTSDSLRHIHVGLGWNEHPTIQADLDSFIIQLDSEGKYFDTIYFGSLESKDGAIVHHGDNLTGGGRGLNESNDKEAISIDLNKLNPLTKELLIGVNIYERRLNFSQVGNAFVRIENTDTSKELVFYDLSNEFGATYSMAMGKIIKNDDGTWSFKAVGEATVDGSIGEFRKKHTNGEASEKHHSPSYNSSNSQPEEKRGFFSRLFK